jgi:aminocarboxymuconate-semialdehyde decarboxylase
MGELQLAGIEIGTNVNGKSLDHPDVVAVLERAEALGAAVFVHPWDVLGAGRLSRYWMQWLVGMPAETAAAICSLIFSGTLDRLPRLRIAFAHGGGSFPGTLGRIARGHATRPDLCAQEHPHDPRLAARRLYYDSLVHDADTLRSLVRLAGAERVALGSDYPFPLGEEPPGRLIDSLEELDDASRRRLLGGTALEFLGLSDARLG